MKKLVNFKYIYASISLGFIIGILTVIGQKYLPGDFNSIANSGAIWLIPSYFIANKFSNIKYSIISSILCLLNSVIGYYFFEPILNNHSFMFFSYYILIWIICAIIAGIIFGVAANISRFSNNVLYKNFGKAMLPSVFLAEGLNILLHKVDYSHMINVGYAWILFSIVLSVIIYKKEILRKEAIISLLLATILGQLFYQTLFMIT